MEIAYMSDGMEKAPIEKQEVVNRLKDYGFEDPTTKELRMEWELQLRTVAAAITDKNEQYKAKIKVEIEIANAYKEAGFLEKALYAYKDAQEFAFHSGEDELYDQLTWLIESISD